VIGYIGATAIETEAFRQNLLLDNIVGTAFPRLTAIKDGLASTGFKVGQNVSIRLSERSSIPAQMDHLLSERVDIIAPVGNVAARVALEATDSIPIVYLVGGDPVALGLAESVKRPARNATGVSILTTVSETKRLELLSQVVPLSTKLGVLINATTATAGQKIQELTKAAEQLGREVLIVHATDRTEAENAFQNAKAQGIGGLHVGSDGFLAGESEFLARLSQQNTLPAIAAFREFALAGGVASYGPSIRELHRQQGIYIGRILSGEKPSDLPVVQPTIMEFVLNLRASKALGLNLSPSLIALADEVIE
jgi:putative ABC transport system substrate-binding protein